MADRDQCDVLIVGCGMAGASLGAHLAAHRRVIVLEREERPGTQATGRSAALYAPGYGDGAVRALTKASASTFDLSDTAEDACVRARATLLVATKAQLDRLERTKAADPALFERLDAEAVRALIPIMRRDVIVGGLIDRSSGDIDVDRLLQRYLRQMRAVGGEIACQEYPVEIVAIGGRWQVTTNHRRIEAAVLVDAAGAWADEVARLAGVAPIGLSPRRRTAALVDAPAAARFADWPAVIDIDERFYFKPDAGKLLVSPAEETPVEPHDAYSDDEALAEGIDRIMQLTTIEVTRAPTSWAGLRTFAPDRVPVIGYDRTAPAPFFWLAGQGGYGIQTAPAAADLAAALVTGGALPNFADPALVAALSPVRLR